MGAPAVFDDPNLVACAGLAPVIALAARRAEAAVPEHVGFATELTLAAAMVGRALNAGVPARWVAGDEVYGGDPALARHREVRGIGYVLNIAANCRLPLDASLARTAAQIAAGLPHWSWQTRSAGTGAHGPRLYQWAWVQLHPSITAPPRRRPRRGNQPAEQPEQPKQPEQPEQPGCWSVLIRRHPRTRELAYYACYSPTPVPLSALITVAGRRWTIEEAFQTSKGLTGLDSHQVRRWTSWRRWTLLVMLAHALLAVATVSARRSEPTPGGLIALTCNEVRRLVNATLSAHPAGDAVAWSTWRRRHQYRARAGHYARRHTRT